MRTGKILPWWGGALALGGLLFWGPSQARMQAADLCLPPVHQFRFVVVRIPATGAGPLGDGTVYAGLTFPNGAQAGQIYQDQTQHKLKLVILGPTELPRRPRYGKTLPRMCNTTTTTRPRPV